MNYALVGYGRMGREIEIQAERRGHRLVRIVDPVAEGRRVRRRLDRGALAGVDVAFEFTRPDAAEANVISTLEAGVATVCGTTGWTPGAAVRRALRGSARAAVIAPNFSVGMNLFYEILRQATERLGASGLYHPCIVEWHHRGKLDAPSGTARRLAAIVAQADPRGLRAEEGMPAAGLAEGAFQVVGIRAGHEPGTHTVAFEGEHDVIRLEHRARGRSVFALGAVLAGEWVVDRRGLHGFDRVLRDLLSAGAKGRRRRSS